MRGKGNNMSTGCLNLGITPAYAGKRNMLYLYESGHWDHPRLCGEKSTLDSPLLNSTGSPPPMRGKGKAERTLMGRDGITPAYAGKRGDIPLSFMTL